MRVLLTTDVFPPVCGGSGWSTYELARGLRARGHEITIVRPRFGPPREDASGPFDGFRPLEFRAWAPGVPFVRNYFRNEGLAPRFARRLRGVVRERRIDVVHAQHRLSGPPSIAAARAEGVPAACTVRDYWPLCYWSDLLLDPDRGGVCPACTPGRMTRCVRPRGGALWPLAVPLVPYMRADLRRKQDALARADAVVAISSAVARDLSVRARGLPRDRVTIIPNPVDVRAVQAEAAEQPAPLDRPYVLYAGKLETNKGVSKLLPALAAAGIDATLVVAGDGAERSTLEAAARAARRDVRFLGWLPRPALLGWMRHAALLLFPSHWPEPFGRVLVEAGAVGCPAAALETGGVGDIVIHEETGLLAQHDDEIGRHVARLWGDAGLRDRLGAAAQRRVERTFDTRVVAARVEALYERLSPRGRCIGQGGGPGGGPGGNRAVETTGTNHA